MTLSVKNSESTQPRSPATKQPSSLVAETLTPSEVESLRQDKRETGALYKKAFDPSAAKPRLKKAG